MNASSVIEEVARSIAQRAINATAMSPRADTSTMDQNRLGFFFPAASPGGASIFAGGAGAAPAVGAAEVEVTDCVIGGPATRASCRATLGSMHRPQLAALSIDKGQTNTAPGARSRRLCRKPDN